MNQCKFSQSRVNTRLSGGDWYNRLVEAPIGMRTERSRMGGDTGGEAIAAQPGRPQNSD
jgi:hypothetical protein